MLRTVATTGAVAAGVSAAGSGTAMASRPASPARAEQLLAAHADGVLATLEAEGVVEDATALRTEGVALGPQVGAVDGAASVRLPEGVEEVRVTTTVEDGRLSVAVRPETGHAYAVLDAAGETLRFDADGASSVSPQSYSCNCRNEVCDWPSTIEVCRDDTTGEIVDTNCVC